MNYVATEDPDDLEIGAVVFSLSLQDSRGWRGGIILDVRRDDDGVLTGVTCVEWNAGRPSLVDIHRADLDMPSARFYGQEARGAASQIASYCGGRNRPKDGLELARWMGYAGKLADAGTAGLYLPGAERRYRATRRVEREANAW